MRHSYLKALGFQPPFYDYERFLALQKVAEDMYIVLVNEIGKCSVTADYEQLFPCLKK